MEAMRGGYELLEHVPPAVVGGMAHHCDAPDAVGYAVGHITRGFGVDLARRRREHEADRVGAGLDGRGDRGFIGEAADLDEHAHAATFALPASRIAATSAAGSSLFISAVPTSASR